MTGQLESLQDILSLSMNSVNLLTFTVCQLAMITYMVVIEKLENVLVFFNSLSLFALSC